DRPDRRDERSQRGAGWAGEAHGFETGPSLSTSGAGFYATSGLGKDEVHIAYVLESEDLERTIAVLVAALPAYRKALGLDEHPAVAAAAGATASARLSRAKKKSG